MILEHHGNNHKRKLEIYKSFGTTKCGILEILYFVQIYSRFVLPVCCLTRAKCFLPPGYCYTVFLKIFNIHIIAIFKNNILFEHRKVKMSVMTEYHTISFQICRKLMYTFLGFEGELLTLRNKKVRCICRYCRQTTNINRSTVLQL